MGHEWNEPGPACEEALSAKAVYGSVVTERVSVDVPSAHALTVGPDEVLVVVLPGHVDPAQMQAHRDRIREVLGNRCLVVAGDDVRLAKVKIGDCPDRALEPGR